MTLRTRNDGNCGLLLLMGDAGFIPSTAVRDPLYRLFNGSYLDPKEPPLFKNLYKEIIIRATKP